MENGSPTLLGVLAMGFAKALVVLPIVGTVLMSWLGAAVVSCTNTVPIAAGCMGSMH